VRVGVPGRHGARPLGQRGKRQWAPSSRSRHARPPASTQASTSPVTCRRAPARPRCGRGRAPVLDREPRGGQLGGQLHAVLLQLAPARRHYEHLLAAHAQLRMFPGLGADTMSTCSPHAHHLGCFKAMAPNHKHCLPRAHHLGCFHSLPRHHEHLLAPRASLRCFQGLARTPQAPARRARRASTCSARPGCLPCTLRVMPNMALSGRPAPACATPGCGSRARRRAPAAAPPGWQTRAPRQC